MATKQVTAILQNIDDTDYTGIKIKTKGVHVELPTDINYGDTDEMYDRIHTILVSHGVTHVRDTVVADESMTLEEWNQTCRYQGHNFG